MDLIWPPACTIGSSLFSPLQWVNMHHVLLDHPIPQQIYRKGAAKIAANLNLLHLHLIANRPLHHYSLAHLRHRPLTLGSPVA
ncbi:hypothetical protein QM996_32600 (plasmid) [Sinorhizobium chiapasense]